MIYPRRTCVILCVAALAATALASCTSSGRGSARSTSPGIPIPTVSPSAFTPDFSAMAQLAPLAAEGNGSIGVLLPDTASARYAAYDAPLLEKAFRAAGLTERQFRIDNAQGSTEQMQAQAQADLAAGASVLLVDAIDPVSGAAIESAAAAAGVKVIDYDRLVAGGSSTRRYVGFDSAKVGQLIGAGAVSCIRTWRVARPRVLVMAGDPADNNARLATQGYTGVLRSYFDTGTYVNAGEPPGTANPSAAQATFAERFAADPRINAVITASDDTADAVITYLQDRGVRPRRFPTTGQGATLAGLQNILRGYQCGTVYQPIYQEAQAAATVALYLRAGRVIPAELANGSTRDLTANADVASTLLTPRWVTSLNMAATVVADGAVQVADLCTPALAGACSAARIS